MPKLVSIANTLVEQPGGSIHVNDQDVWRITRKYSCPASRLVALLPRQFATDPEFSFAKLSEVTGVRIEGDLAEMDCVYVGQRDPGGSGSEHVLELIAGTSEDPIETHPRYAEDLTSEDIDYVEAILRGDKTWRDSPITYGEDQRPVFSGPNADVQAEYYDKKRKGIESYLADASTLRESWSQPATTALPSLSDVGTIVSPPPGAPALHGGANWLLANFSVKRSGGIYEISKEYRASGKGGWDPELYE